MKENKGHARCNAFGVRYVNNNENFDYLILMDGDGEDRPAEIKIWLTELKKIQIILSLQKELKDQKVIFFNFCIFFIN